jgi:lipopolysaccharide/colanic/teichoic acid biosynthesis glycosyltransferase
MAAKPFTSTATARANGSSTRQPIKARGSGRTRSFDHYLHRHEVAARGRRPNVRPPARLTTTIPVVDENSLRLEHVVATFDDRRRTVYERLVKPVLDRVSAALLLAAFGPLLALIAIAVWVTLGSPIMLTQERVGQHGRTFGMFKFRTMHPDRRNGQRSNYRGPERRKTHKSADDPRHTRLGRRLRKTSLDELPQLINVLRGDLSLVGPRPHALQAKAADQLYQDAVDGYFTRHKVKPGITGWAQVNGWRGETDTQEKIRKRVEYDIYYIENWSLAFDISILLKTPMALLKADNAY